jgi:hypothetical protein
LSLAAGIPVLIPLSASTSSGDYESIAAFWMAYHGFALKLLEVICMKNINQATQPTQSILSLLFCLLQ